MKKQAITASLVTVFTALAAVSTYTFAQQAPKPEQLIKWRQSAYQTIAWNLGRVKASVDGPFNKDEVVRASASLAAVADAGLPSLFAPGTENGKGWRDTIAKPAFFTESRAGELQGNFQKEANELARIAQGGDAAAVKDQFNKVSRTCKACHDDYRVQTN